MNVLISIAQWITISITATVIVRNKIAASLVISLINIIIVIQNSDTRC
jgi:hypothetical protein